MPADLRDPNAFALLTLRALVNVAQGTVAQVRGWTLKQASRRETGHQASERAELDAVAADLGYEPHAVDVALAFREALLRCRRDRPRPSARAARPVEAILGELARELPGWLEEAFARMDEHRARQEADAAWQLFARSSAQERRWMVEGVAEYQTVAFCRRLCEESAQVAAHDPTKALALARLAAAAAERAPEEEEFRSRLRGWAAAFVGNAWKAKGTLRESDTAFTRCRQLWNAGADPAGRLPAGRVDDLEASLRIKQDRFGEALALLDQALGTAEPAAMGALYIRKAHAQEESGDSAGALLTLETAKAHIDPVRQPRLHFARRFNRVGNLVNLKRHAEGRARLPQLQEMVLDLGGELDFWRVRWLEGRLAAGLDDRAVAITALEEVRREFAARDILYDVGLVTLELAALYLEAGRWSTVQAMARKAAVDFSRDGVEAEARVAMKLFCEAAVRERLTIQLLAELQKTLRKASRRAAR